MSAREKQWLASVNGRVSKPGSGSEVSAGQGKAGQGRAGTDRARALGARTLTTGNDAPGVAVRET